MTIRQLEKDLRELAFKSAMRAARDSREWQTQAAGEAVAYHDVLCRVSRSEKFVLEELMAAAAFSVAMLRLQR